jgi:outer membrane protein assembly factor BamD
MLAIVSKIGLQCTPKHGFRIEKGRNMKKSLLVVSLMTVLAGMLAGCGSTTDPYQGETPHTIYTYGKTATKDKNFSEAVKRFEALDVQYPYGTETENAQLYIIYAYYMKDEYTLAASAAERYIRLYPASEHVDYAYYMRGLSDFYKNLGLLERLFPVDLSTRDLVQIRKSYVDFSELAARFPESKYAPSSHQYMVYLRNLIASYEVDTAQFYYDRKAYVASANRASDVVAHYQGAPAVVNALELMVKSYHKLGMKKDEQEALLVLKYNYPDKQVLVD